MRENLDGGDLPPEVNTMLEELQNLHPTIGGPTDEVGRYEHTVRTAKMAGGAFSDQILEMSPESQQVYFQIASGNYPHNIDDKPYGTFIREVEHLNIDDVAVMVDANHHHPARHQHTDIPIQRPAR